MKVAVAMSGGVDSSVAALLLKEQGHNVTGISMSVWDDEQISSPTGKHSCYGPDENEDLAKAKGICDSLGIPFHVFDCKREYHHTFIDSGR